MSVHYRRAQRYVIVPTSGASQLNSSLLTLSVIAVLLPAAFHSAVQPRPGSIGPLTDAQEGHDILSISHGVSGFFFVILLQLTIIQLGRNYTTLQ